MIHYEDTPSRLTSETSSNVAIAAWMDQIPLRLGLASPKNIFFQNLTLKEIILTS